MVRILEGKVIASREVLTMLLKLDIFVNMENSVNLLIRALELK